MTEQHGSSRPTDARYAIRSFEGMPQNNEAYTESLITLVEKRVVSSFTGLEEAARVFSGSNIRISRRPTGPPLPLISSFVGHLAENYEMGPLEAPLQVR